MVDAYAEHPDQIGLSPYVYVADNPVDKTDPDGNCPPCDVPSEEEVTGNGGSIIENIIGAAKDDVTSGVFTLGSIINSGVTHSSLPSEYSFDYSSGERKLVSTPISTPLGVITATFNALIGTSNAIPIEGPAAGVFAKVQGVKTSATTIIKDVVHANSKLSTKVNTLYRLETTEGKYLKTGITSKAIPEKRYSNKFMKGKVMKKIDKGSRSEMLKKERHIVERDPGIDNHEPWAGILNRVY